MVNIIDTHVGNAGPTLSLCHQCQPTMSLISGQCYYPCDQCWRKVCVYIRRISRTLCLLYSCTGLIPSPRHQYCSPILLILDQYCASTSNDVAPMSLVMSTHGINTIAYATNIGTILAIIGPTLVKYRFWF